MIKAERLAGLQPEAVFGYFEKLCTMPHGSGNTKQISDYFVSFAKENGLRYIQDDADNVILFKDASAGYEDHAPVILQAHMDMVCQVDEGSGIDMAITPLDVTHDEKYVYARGTSLGADDGSGVALALAVLADKTLAHPPLEVIFTSGEEAGMTGAKAVDLSMLKGKRLLNMDTLSEGKFTAGCAGSARVTLTLPVEKQTMTVNRVQITLDGLRGGHSGSLIKYGYPNANKAMAELLKLLQPLRLICLDGGMSGNAIPRSCKAVVAAGALEMKRILTVCDSFTQQLKAVGEENVSITAQVLEAGEYDVLSVEETTRVLDFILGLPNGVQTWDTRLENLPQTSLNLGIMKLTEELSLLHHIRSSVNAERQGLQDLLKKLVEQSGGSYSDTGVYSAWEYRPESAFRNKLVAVYEKVYGKTPDVVVIHAGLECGIFSEKIPGLDCVSAGPSALYIHTNREKMDIASMSRFWNYLLEVLKAL